jgi:hypothetical protein
MELKERLENAIASGEILEIKYFGGSNPGKPRNISPVKIDGNRLIARCLQSNEVKSFSLEKISFSDEKDSYEVSTKVIEHLNLQSFTQITDFLNEYKQSLEQLGWFVKLENSESLSLYSYFKNGKLKKTYDINISYEKFSTEEIYDPDTDNFIVEKKEKQKPWCVRAKGETTRSLSTLPNAIEIFLTFSDKYAIKQ